MLHLIGIYNYNCCLFCFQDGPMGRSGGIGILAQNFMLDDCSADAKLCMFLRMHQSISNEINRIKYYGRITAKKLKMEGSTVTWMALHKNFHFGPGVRFKLTVGEKGDRNVMYAHVYFRNSRERYPGMYFVILGNPILILSLFIKVYKSNLSAISL